MRMNTAQKIIKVGCWLETLVDMSIYAINHKAKNRELAVHRLLSIQRIEDEIKKCSETINDFISKFGHWNYNADFTHLERKVIDGRFSFSWLDIEK